jgi:hypothetical protein
MLENLTKSDMVTAVGLGLLAAAISELCRTPSRCFHRRSNSGSTC